MHKIRALTLTSLLALAALAITPTASAELPDSAIACATDAENGATGNGEACIQALDDIESLGALPEPYNSCLNELEPTAWRAACEAADEEIAPLPPVFSCILGPEGLLWNYTLGAGPVGAELGSGASMADCEAMLAWDPSTRTVFDVTETVVPAFNGVVGDVNEVVGPEVSDAAALAYSFTYCLTVGPESENCAFAEGA